MPRRADIKSALIIGIGSVAISIFVLFSNSVHADDPAPLLSYNSKAEVTQTVYTHDYITKLDFEKGITYTLTILRDNPCPIFQIFIPNSLYRLLDKTFNAQKSLPASHLCEFKTEIVTVSNARLPKKVTAKSTYHSFPINDGTMISYYNLKWIGNTPAFIIKYNDGGKSGGITDYYSCGIKTGLSELMGGFTGIVTKPSMLCFPIDIPDDSQLVALPTNRYKDF